MGLHPHDLHYILECLFQLRDAGNTVIIVEHNLDIIRIADFILDMGPEGGAKGGYVIAQGSLQDIMKNRRSQTGKVLKKFKI